MPTFSKRLFLVILVIVLALFVIIPGVLYFVGLGLPGASQTPDRGALGSGGLLISRDSGESWAKADTPENKREKVPTKILNVYFHPTNPNTVYLGTKSSGLWKSSNSGDTWQRVTDKTGTLKPASDVYKISISRQNTKVIYLAVYQDSRGRVLRSSDGGDSFTEIYFVNTKGYGIFDLYASGYNADTVYVTTGQGGFFETVNGGKTWRVKKWFGESLIRLLVNPRAESEMYLVTSSFLILKTLDTGENWTDISTQIAADLQATYQQTGSKDLFTLKGSPFSFRRNIESLAMSPLAPGLLYVGFPNLIARSFNGGGSWQNLQIPLPPDTSDLSTVVLNPKNSDNLFVGAGYQLYKSADQGIHWKIISLPSSRKIKTIYINPLKPDLMLAVFQ